MMETRQRSEFPTEIGPPLSSWCWIILATLIWETRIYLTARVSHVQVRPTLEIAHVILDELTNEGRNCATQLAPRSPSLRRVCFPHTMLTGNCQCIMVHPSTSTAGSLDKPWLVAVVTSSLTPRKCDGKFLAQVARHTNVGTKGIFSWPLWELWKSACRTIRVHWTNFC